MTQSKRVIVHKDSGYYNILLADTPEELAGAVLYLFQCFDRDQYYQDLEDEPEAPSYPIGHIRGCKCDSCEGTDRYSKRFASELASWKEERGWYDAAKKGNYLAAFNLLSARKDNEYEGWTFEELDTKTVPYNPSNPFPKHLISK